MQSPDAMMRSWSGAWADMRPGLIATARLHLKGIAIAVAIMTGVAMAIVFFASTEHLNVEVDGFQWVRQIDIERFQTMHQGGWYHPGDAYNVAASSRLHHFNTFSTCSGSGKTRSCTNYSIPVYETWYDYDVDRWGYAYSLKNIGYQRNNLTWPDKLPTPCAAVALGCEQEAQRIQIYTVNFVTNKAEKLHCDFTQDAWMTYRNHGAYNLDVGRFTRWPQCDTVKANS